MLTGPEECVEEFRKGYNCSQALLAIYSKDVVGDKETATKESLFTDICPKIIKDAAEIVEGIL